ncbi:MAG: hypothetical protein NTX50_16260, partial [Candidatus Sumerlaeota bacterium]|nr:hypothetical protein [Candidatus Sumerlaeota bacterium]
ENQSSLTFGTARPDRNDLYYDCSGGNIADWRPGEWRHIALMWSRREGRRQVFVDGKLRGKGPFTYSQSLRDGPLYIGGGCDLFPGKTAHARLDEVAIWDRPLDEAAIARLYQLGMEGKPLWPAARALLPAQGTSSTIRGVIPCIPRILPSAPGRAIPIQISRLTASREEAILNGWRPFFLSEHPLNELPEKGWGEARAPGYWTAGESVRVPDGRASNGAWNGRSLSEYAVGYYRFEFAAPPAWKEKSVLLHLDGVDGLADLFLNDRWLGTLPPWENEDFDLSQALRWERENTLILALRARGEKPVAGIYGKISLRIAPRSMVRDIVIRPSVAEGRIAFSCDIWHLGAPADARLEFDVCAAAAPDQVAKQFQHSFRLTQDALKTAADGAAISSQTRREECSFAWPDARLWTYDDPALYQVRARLYLGDTCLDEAPPARFGFREFTLRGGDFVLNGKPTHLRGHQIDLGWSDQMSWVRELKGAGMNCFEFSGPISSSWYSGVPYQAELYEQILDYADEHGLIALPILPGAEQLRNAIFDPDVARLYRERLDKFIRRYGNHPSICLWYMHFNLAGYHWYVAPSKMDGSYKPSDPAFQAKERYALAAQRIAQSLDSRPLYHHACGNFGDIYSMNCYIGPNSPLQEREEWPLRWAGKRPFPLLACEHCLMLIPYWFRPRQFPLSVVYAGEPIFDELAAQYLGRRAYGMITPELFDLYDMGRPPRRNRYRELIRRHPGYQEVKSQFAQYSLRSWRTFGVSGIIFNAIQWDFRDGAGKPLPVLKALGRYFNDTDLYIAGPGSDWPSKDHAFYSGEAIRKQAVLLNDLTRDISCALEWRLEDANGAALQSGRIEAIARAGMATTVEIEFQAPSVSERSEYCLKVSPIGKGPEGLASAIFLPEVFALHVFPRPADAAAPQSVAAPQSATTPRRGKAIVYDPIGETTLMLAKAKFESEPLGAQTDLKQAVALIVGKKTYGPEFLALARKAGLAEAINGGLNLLIFEQTTSEVLGLRLKERSSREVFIAQADHSIVRGLQPADFINLRGESDLVEAYPEAPPETERVWPERCFKWGNRGVTATFVYRKPHFAPFVPILECGFDLVDSPLLEGRLGDGRALLCQVDVTSRYGLDPVATRLVDQMLEAAMTKETRPRLACVCLGDSAKHLAAQFGATTEAFDAGRRQIILAGTEPVSPSIESDIEAAVRRGSTLILAPGGALYARFGLACEPQRFFIGKLSDDPLLTGLSDGDLYLKNWTTIDAATEKNGWKILAAPGILAAKSLGEGRLIAVRIDPERLGATRARVKVLRFWNILLSNLGAAREPFDHNLLPALRFYEDNPWEELPPYIDW